MNFMKYVIAILLVIIFAQASYGQKIGNSRMTYVRFNDGLTEVIKVTNGDILIL